MKLLIISFALSFFSFGVYAQSKIIPPKFKLAVQAYNQGLYYTAATHLNDYIKEMSGKGLNAQAYRLLDRILVRTNVFPFLSIPLSTLQSHKGSSAISYLMAKKYFMKKDYKSSLKHFSAVKSNSPFHLQSLLHLSGIAQLLGEIPASISYSERCMRRARRGFSITPYGRKSNDDLREFIHDSCEINIARAYYKQNDIQKSEKFFSQIPLNSYHFPTALFENSWNYYLQRNFGRSVGKNITFQAPALENYFIPETELVKALSYSELCLWDDVIGVIRSFDGNIKKQAQEMISKYNLKSKKNPYPFVNLLINQQKLSEVESPLFQRLARIINLRPGMKVLMFYLEQVRSEKKVIEQKASSRSNQLAYNKAYSNYVSFMNAYIKLQFINFANEIIRINNIFAEMEVDLYSQLKYQHYDQEREQDEIQEDGKGPSEKLFFIRKLKRDKSQHYWNFHGEFWADELGSYIPVLENQCKEKL